MKPVFFFNFLIMSIFDHPDALNRKQTSNYGNPWK